MSEEHQPPTDPTAPRDRLQELALLFLRLGATAFGGPAAHIAMMEAEIVRRRRWLSHDEFLDLVSATNLIPGPNSTEMAIHIGRQRAGWPGLIVAGTCFILPAVLSVLALAWIYVAYGTLPQIDAALYGIKPVLIAVIGQALWALGRKALKSTILALLAALAVLLRLAGLDEVLIIVAIAAGHLLLQRRPAQDDAKDRNRLPAAAVIPLATAGATTLTQAGPATLFTYFLKIGSVLFGSGYVLLAFLRSDLVERWHWLTAGQLLDAVAVGQFTPGPVFTTATFIGYLVAGFPGALAATAGIFLPAFVLVALTGSLIPKLRASRAAGAFLDGANAASLALMAVVTWELATDAVRDPLALAIAGCSAVALLQAKVNATRLILAGAALGLVVRWSGWSP